MFDIDSDDVRVVAEVEFSDDCSDSEVQEIISRLDDGNDYPGFVTKRESGTLYVCVEE